MTPFLTFITPTYKRPKGLAACLASVGQQTAAARIQQVVIADHVGVGIGGMYASLPAYAGSVLGQYVHVLCDDDELAAPDAVERVERFALEQEWPPVILVATNKGGLQWPAGQPWPPMLGQIDLGCFIVRADVWKAHVQHYGQCYEGDWMFADAVYRAGHRAAWCDLLFSVGGVSRGAAEAA